MLVAPQRTVVQSWVLVGTEWVVYEVVVVEVREHTVRAPLAYKVYRQHHHHSDPRGCCCLDAEVEACLFVVQPHGEKKEEEDVDNSVAPASLAMVLRSDGGGENSDDEEEEVGLHADGDGDDDTLVEALVEEDDEVLAEHELNIWEEVEVPSTEAVLRMEAFRVGFLVE